MGLEATCNATWEKQTSHGKAQLETDYILFRGEFRLKVPFADLLDVETRNGTLNLRLKAGVASFQLGPAAEKWADKILNPPSRLQKLGIKPGVKVALEGELEPGFVAEIQGQRSATESSDLVFLAVESSADLRRIPEVLAHIPASSALWIIYPKGKQTIRETTVISSGRAAGLTDIKVVSFSATHTGLKFVRSKAARER